MASLKLNKSVASSNSGFKITSGASSISPLQNLQQFPLLFALQHHSRNVLRNYSNQTHTGPYPAWIRGRLKWLKTIDVSHPLFCSQMCVLGKKWKRFSLNVFHSTYIFEIVAIFFVKSFSVYVNLNELKEPEWNRTARRSWEVAGLPFILTKYFTVLWNRQVLLVIFDR